MAEFRICLCQQVQILQTEYPSRILQEHVEEVKQDHFSDGLSPEYWQMLAHKVDGENPVFYSKLFLTAQKLERWAEARDPLLPNITIARSLNVAHSHSQGNLFPSRKLKGSCTFTAQSVVADDRETEEDSGPKPNREMEAESSAEVDMGMLVEIGDVDPFLGYIMWFAIAVELYQKKNHNCFRCGSPDYLVKDCPKDLAKTARKGGLNLKEWVVKKGGQSSQKLVVTQQTALGDAPQA